MPLRVWVRVISEVAKSDFVVCGEGVAEDLLAQEVYEIGCRRARGVVSPFRQRQVIVGTLEAVCEDGGQQQEAVGSDLELGLAIDGSRGARLCLGYPYDAFLVVVIDLDLPAIDVNLHDRLQVQVWISANEESRFAIEEFGAFAQAIPDGFDYDQKQRFIMSGLAPEDGANGLDVEVAELPDRETGDLLQRHLVIAQDFFWGRGFRTILARPAVGFGVRVQRQAKVGVEADTPDECRACWKPLEEDLVGVATIDGDEQLAQPGIVPLIEGLAEIDDSRKPDCGKGEGLLAFLVIFPLLGRGILFGLRDRRGRLEADGQGAGGALAMQRRNHQRGLNETESADEVDVIGRRLRIANGSHAGNAAS